MTRRNSLTWQIALGVFLGLGLDFGLWYSWSNYSAASRQIEAKRAAKPRVDIASEEAESLVRLVRMHEEAAVRSTPRRLSMLVSAIDAFEEDVGRIPFRLGELADGASIAGPSDAWKGPYLDSDPVDAWGTEIVLKPIGARSASGYQLISAGPDRMFGTSDDIRGGVPRLANYR